MYIFAYFNIYVHKYIFVYMYIYISMYTQVYKHAHMRLHMYMQTHTHTHTYTHTHSLSLSHTHSLLHTHSLSHTHTLSLSLTHTCSPISAPYVLNLGYMYFLHTHIHAHIYSLIFHHVHLWLGTTKRIIWYEKVIESADVRCQARACRMVNWGVLVVSWCESCEAGFTGVHVVLNKRSVASATQLVVSTHVWMDPSHSPHGQPVVVCWPYPKCLHRED